MKTMHNKIEMNKLYSHPLAQQFSDVVGELEKLPPSEQQTKTVTALNKLSESVAKEINKLNEKIESFKY